VGRHALVVEVTFEEGRTSLGWKPSANGRTKPLRGPPPFCWPVLARHPPALQLSHDGQIPVPVTAWYHKAEPTSRIAWVWYANISGVRGIWCTLLQRQSASHFLRGSRSLDPWPFTRSVIGQSRVKLFAAIKDAIGPLAAAGFVLDSLPLAGIIAIVFALVQLLRNAYRTGAVVSVPQMQILTVLEHTRDQDR